MSPIDCHPLIVINQLPSIVTYQLPSTNCHQPIAIRQLSPTTCHPHQLSPTNCRRQIVTHQLPTTNRYPPIVTNQLSPTNCHQPIVHQLIVFSRGSDVLVLAGAGGSCVVNKRRQSRVQYRSLPVTCARFHTKFGRVLGRVLPNTDTRAHQDWIHL